MNKERGTIDAGRRRLLLLFVFTFLLAAAGLTGLFPGRAKAADSGNAAAQENYLYLACLSAGEGDTDTALLYLKKLYASGGETPEGTLLNARIMAMRGDFEGAQVLYEKLRQTGNTEVLEKADEELYAAVKDGEAMSCESAAAVLSEVRYLTQNKKKPEDYGYTPERIALCEQIASGELDYALIMQEASAEDAAAKEKANKSLGDLKRAFALAEEANDNYILYATDLSHDADRVREIAEELTELYEKSPSLFSVAAIDEAFVKALIMVNDKDTLVDYAYTTNSQYALMSVAQLISDRHLKEEDLPEQELNISGEELKQVIHQVDKALAQAAGKTGGFKD